MLFCSFTLGGRNLSPPHNPFQLSIDERKLLKSMQCGLGTVVEIWHNPIAYLHNRERYVDQIDCSTVTTLPYFCVPFLPCHQTLVYRINQ